MRTIEEFTSRLMKTAVPDFRVGDVVRVNVNIFEGTKVQISKKGQKTTGKDKGEIEKERTQVFEGTVLGIMGKGLSQTFRVRKISSGVGVEKVFFTHSPKVLGIEVVRRSEPRRAKLYYLRKRVGKAVRLAEKRITVETETVQATENGNETNN